MVSFYITRLLTLTTNLFVFRNTRCRLAERLQGYTTFYLSEYKISFVTWDTYVKKGDKYLIAFAPISKPMQLRPTPHERVRFPFKCKCVLFVKDKCIIPQDKYTEDRCTYTVNAETSSQLRETTCFTITLASIRHSLASFFPSLTPYWKFTIKSSERNKDLFTMFFVTINT